MGIFDKKPYTAVSTETEALLAQGSKVDASKLLNLIELIQNNDAGCRECGRVLRKKIKYGTGSDQLASVSLTEMIVDNGVSTAPFIVDSRLSEQLVQLAASHTNKMDVTKEGKAARHCRSLLQSWQQRTDRNLSQLFSKAGLVDKPTKSMFRRSLHVDDDLDSDFQNQFNDHRRSFRHSRSLSGHSAHRNRSPSPVNLRGASIDTVVATSHNVATKLTTSLIESPNGSPKVEEYYRQAKQLRKKVIQLIQDNSQEVQSLVGPLLNANEELIAALQAHDAVLQGDDLQEQDDHERIERIQPARPAPVGAYDPFADEHAQDGKPQHTPLW